MFSTVLSLLFSIMTKISFDILNNTLKVNIMLRSCSHNLILNDMIYSFFNKSFMNWWILFEFLRINSWMSLGQHGWFLLHGFLMFNLIILFSINSWNSKAWHCTVLIRKALKKNEKEPIKNSIYTNNEYETFHKSWEGHALLWVHMKLLSCIENSEKSAFLLIKILFMYVEIHDHNYFDLNMNRY